MANKKRGEVEIELLDGTYTMHFSFNTICTIEERLGKSIDQLFFQGDISRIAIREAMACALKGRHMGMTSNKVGRLIDPTKMQQYVMAIFEGLAYANGQSEEQIKQMRDMLNDETDGEAIDADVVDQKEGGDAPLQLANGTTGTS